MELNINPAMTITIEGPRQSGKSRLATTIVKAIGSYDIRILSDDHATVILEAKKKKQKGQLCKQ